MSKVYDTIVVGGGPSGMMSAALVAKAGKNVLLLEKNKNLGEKLSITGGGRCNITNAEFDNRKLLENYGEASKFLHSPFSRFSVKDTFSFFESLSLPIVVEARKRAFPKSQKATDVTKTLEKFVKRNQVEVITNFRVKDLKSEKDIFALSDGKTVYKAKTVIFAPGGPSGSSIKNNLPLAWNILAKLGHTIHNPSPNLAPLTTRAKFVHRLSGLSMSFVALRFKVEDKTIIKKLGKVLFTHFGVSGPTVINSSYEALKILEKNKKLTLSIDFFPDTDFDKLDKRLVNLINKNPKKKLRNILAELVPEELAKTVIFISNKDLLEENANNISREDRRKIVHKLKDFHFNITGAKSDSSIIADGGVDLSEVDFKHMESKLVPNLYLTGDVLNINRPSGGFSLQLCWTTAYVAAQSVIDKLNKSKN